MNTQTHRGLHSLRCKYATIRTYGGNVRGKYPRGEMSGGKCPGGKCPGGEMSGYHALLIANR